MKELFNTLSGISNFFNEKRFIFVGETPNNEPNPLEPPPFQPQSPEELAMNMKNTANELFAQAKIEGRQFREESTYDVDKVLAETRAQAPAAERNLRDKAVASLSGLQGINTIGGGDRDIIAREATKSLSGLGAPEELAGRIEGKKEEAPLLAKLDRQRPN
jgi:hypothetical protein